MSEGIQDESPQGKRNQSFTGDKLDWMSAVSHDRRLEPSHFEIAFWIAQHISGRWRKGFPSQDVLAELAGTSTRTVERAVKLLTATGWLNVERERTYDHKARKYKTHNTYSMRMDNVQAALDEITILRRNRRLKHDTSVGSENVLRSVTGDTLGGKPDTGVGLTPSNKQEEERREVGS